VATERAAFTVGETAAQVGMCRNSIYVAIRRGDIPSIRIGKKILVPKHYIERLLKGSNPQAAA
jgi:excisionase family DNA binding protein